MTLGVVWCVCLICCWEDNIYFNGNMEWTRSKSAWSVWPVSEHSQTLSPFTHKTWLCLHHGVFMIPRAGSCPGVVVWDTMYALHGSGELHTVREGERRRGYEPHFWDRLRVRLDLLWKIRGPRGKREKNPTSFRHFLFFSSLLFHFLPSPEFKGVGQEGAGVCSSDWLDVVLHGDRLL